MYDVVIIGSGFSGLVCAQRLLQHGLKIALVSDGVGGSAHFSGAFDLVDDLERNSFDESLNDRFKDFIRRRPDHYLAQCQDIHPDFYVRWIEAARSFFDFFAFPVTTSEKGVLSFSNLGVPKWAAFTRSSQGLMPDEMKLFKRVVVVGFEGLVEYPIHSIVANLNPLFENVETLVYNGFSLNPSSSYVSLQHCLKNESKRDEVIQFINTSMSSADLLLMPPLMDKAVFDVFQAKMSMPVREFLSVSPSSAGFYWQQAVQEKLGKIGELDLVSGTAFDFARSKNVVDAILVKDRHDEIQRVRAKSFVLATGKYIGGGLRKEGGISESVFHAPVFVDGDLVTEGAAFSRLLQANPKKHQKFLSVGVKTNHQSKVLGSVVSQVFADNLYACGHVLSDFDFTRERCGFGVSLASSLMVSEQLS